MNRRTMPTLAAFAFVFLLACAVPALAQSSQEGALPTAPGAARASQGGYTAAKASLPGVHGSSPLEPYLVTWLLPVSGLLSVIAAVVIDKRMRGLGAVAGAHGDATRIRTRA